MVTVSLSALEGFHWVAKTGGFTAASKAMPYGITQPAVHKQVRTLERQIGVPLVERTGKGTITLTPEGQRLHEFCAPFFSTLPNILQELCDGAVAGTLRIDTSPGVLQGLLSGVLPPLINEHPELEISVYEHVRVDFLRLAHGETDVIVDFADNIPAPFVATYLCESRPYLIAPVAFGSTSKRTLCDQTFVAYDASMPHYEIQSQGLERLGLRPPKTLRATSADAILRLVAAGLGYSLVPWTDPAGPTHAGVISRPVGTAKDRFPIYAISRPLTAASSIFRAFTERALQTGGRKKRS